MELKLRASVFQVETKRWKSEGSLGLGFHTG